MVIKKYCCTQALENAERALFALLANTIPHSVSQSLTQSVSQSTNLFVCLSVCPAVKGKPRCPLESCVNIDAQNPFNFPKIFTFLGRASSSARVAN